MLTMIQRKSFWYDMLLIWLYFMAISVANGLVTHFGQDALPFTAFFLIPFDLVVRDLLQDRWQFAHAVRQAPRSALHQALDKYQDAVAAKQVSEAEAAYYWWAVGAVVNRSPRPVDRWTLFMKMATIILLGSAMSYLTSVSSSRIALASAVAFTVTGFLDAITYQWMIKYGRIWRINGATVVAAITDSIVFALIAFDHVENTLVALQIGTKALGGFVWSLLLYRLFRGSPR